MKVYKVNKKSMIGTTLLLLMLLGLYIAPLFIQNEFWAGMCFGAATMFAFIHIFGISSLNRENLPIEKVEVDEKYVKENKNET